MKGVLIIIFVTTLAVTLAQYPSWVATIKTKCESSGKKSRFLGAIISDDCLIAAASCFSHCAQNNLSVKAVLNVSRIKVVKDSVIIHPDYDKYKAADLALVKFESPKFQLTKVAINDKCRIKNAISLSVINFVNGKTITKSPIQKYDSKECKELYKLNWQRSTQTCFTTTECVEKPGSFIEGDNTLYAMTTFNSECKEGSNKTIAALPLCKYYEWIKNQLTTPTGKINSRHSSMHSIMCSNIWLHCG